MRVCAGASRCDSALVWLRVRPFVVLAGVARFTDRAQVAQHVGATLADRLHMVCGCRRFTAEPAFVPVVSPTLIDLLRGEVNHHRTENLGTPTIRVQPRGFFVAPTPLAVGSLQLLFVLEVISASLIPRFLRVLEPFSSLLEYQFVAVLDPPALCVFSFFVDAFKPCFGPLRSCAGSAGVVQPVIGAVVGCEVGEGFPLFAASTKFGVTVGGALVAESAAEQLAVLLATDTNLVRVTGRMPAFVVSPAPAATKGRCFATVN